MPGASQLGVLVYRKPDRRLDPPVGILLQPVARLDEADLRSTTRLLFLRDAQGLAVRMTLTAAGIAMFGLPGLIAARMLAGLILIALNLSVVSRLLGIPAAAQVARSLRSVMSAAIMAGATVLVVRHVETVERLPGQALRLAITIAVATPIYAGVHWLLWLATGQPAGAEA